MGLGESLLKLQKRLVGIIKGVGGRYHSDPLMAELGILKVQDLYRQQLRVHAWKFWNGKLPGSQAGMFSRISDIHTHNTRSANTGMFLNTQNHRSICYRVPKEWESMGKELGEMQSLSGFKRKSREGFLAAYKSFVCMTQNCYVCAQMKSQREA